MSGTAEVHTTATLSPSKLELLAEWLPKQAWFNGDPADLERVAFWRFVDPDGEVGIDSMLIRSGEAIYHVPVTWRAEPLDEGDLIGTLEHSELGTRYGYDAVSDPVYVVELGRVIREGDTESDITPVGQADEVLPKSIRVEGSGVVAEAYLAGQLRLVRELGNEDTRAARGLLIGHWNHAGSDREDILAVLR